MGPIYGDLIVACFQLSLMNVSFRLHSQIVNQLSQVLIADEALSGIVNNAVISLFSQNQIAGMGDHSQQFRERCIVLLTTVKKPTLLKSVIVDLLSVLSNQMNEMVFLYKYSTFCYVCFHFFF